jgi:chromosome segregation ATPase
MVRLECASVAFRCPIVIQSILFFVLGFLSAALVALLIAPSIWRRAVTLTRKRIEATVPMTLNEIQAEKDRIRAEFAMAMRRLEMSVQAQREKAAAQAVEIGRQREEIRLLAEECESRSQRNGELEMRMSEAGADRYQVEERVQKLETRFAEASRRLEERALEIEELNRHLEEANFNASNRQIELVARETEIDKLVGDINILRGKLREAEKSAREMSVETKASLEALRTERQRAADLEKKIERMMTDLSDRDEKIDRREKEIARLSEQAKNFQRSEQEVKERVKQIASERDRLEARLAELSQQPPGAIASMTVANGNGVSADQTNDRARFEERLTALVRENKKLRAAVSEAKEANPTGPGAGDDILRAQIHSLAAEVVNLTALVEGADSPIREVLETAGNEDHTNPRGEVVPSLAERIRALQKTSSPPS